MSMSGGNVIDNKVVSLEFQNENFEKNAKVSLSTLERLKNALTFKGVRTKIFDGIGTAAYTGAEGVKTLGGAIKGVDEALGTIKDVTAFSLINNAATDAYNSVKKLISSITIDQIGGGWDKYRDITEAMQTIMSATADEFSSQEEQLEKVTAQMDKLNWFADETAFNLNDMTSAIGKFTSNKVPLDTAVTAIQGIGTWASKSGAQVEEAGRAMYNLSQAISVGSVKLIDWKSIENANMATSQFKQTAIETAEAVGTLTKVEEGLWKTTDGNEVSVTNFNEALKDEWFTSEVLLKSLDKYGAFAVKLNDYATEFNDSFGAANIMDLIDAFKEGSVSEKEWAKAAEESGVELSRLKEIIEDLSQEQYEFGMSAFRAAQETKTFQEAIEYTQEAVSTGWMNTFEIMFGQYTDAKKLWSDLSEYMYEIFVKGGEKRNELLEDAFEMTNTASAEDFKKLTESGLASPEYLRNLRKNAEEAGVIVEKMETVSENGTISLVKKEDLTDLEWINEAIEQGLLSTGDLSEAFEKLGSSAQELGPINEDLKATLDKALEDRPEEIQAILDKLDGHGLEDLNQIIFGDGVYSEEQRELEGTLDSLLKTLGLTQAEGEDLKTVLRSMGYFAEDTGKSLLEMSDEELKTLGYTEKQIELVQKYKDEVEDASEAGLLEYLGINTTSGADHWLNGLYNIMDSIINLKDVLGETFANYFDGIESSQIFDFLTSFDEATEAVKEFIGTTEEGEEGNQAFLNILDAIASTVDLIVGNIDILGKALAMKGIGIGIAQVGKFIGVIKKLAIPVLLAAGAFEFLKGLISGLGLDWGKLGDTIANLTKKFTSWLKVVDPLGKAMDAVGKAGQFVGKHIRSFFDSIAKSDKAVKGVNKLRTGFKVFVAGFGEHMKQLPERMDNFNKKVEEMGGVKPENLGDIFKLATQELGDFIMSFPGIKPIFQGLKLIISSVEDKLRELGVPVDAIKSAFKGLGSTIKFVFGFVIDQAFKSVETISKLWNKFKELPVVKSAIDNFGKAFETVGNTIGPFVEGFGQHWDNLIKRINGLEGGLSFKNAGAIFDAFKEEIINYITNWDGFGAITDAFSKFWEDVKKAFSENETFMSLYHGFMDIVNGLAKVFEDVKIPESLDDLPAFFQSIADAIHNMPEAGEGSGIKGAIWNGIKFVFEKILQIISYVTSHWKTFLKIAIVLLALKKIDMIVGDIRKHYEAINKELKARAFMETAIGVVALAAAIWIVAMTFKDLAQTFGTDKNSGWLEKILPGLVAIIAVVGGMAVLFGVVGKMEVKPGTAWGVAAAVAAVWVIAHAFIDLTESLDTGKGFLANMARLSPALFAIIAVIGGLAALFYVVGKMNPGTGTSWAITAAIASVWIIAHAFIDLTNELNTAGDFKSSMERLGPAIIAIATVIGGLAMLFAVVGGMNPGTGTSWAIVAAMASVYIIAEAFQKLAKLKKADVDKGVKALVVVYGGLIIMMAVSKLANVDWKVMASITGAILAVSAALAALAYVGSVNPEGLDAAMKSLTIVLVGLVALAAVTGLLRPSIAALVLIGVILGLMVAAVVVINEFVGVDNAVTIAGTLTELFLSLAVLMGVVGLIGTFAIGGLIAGVLGMIGMIAAIGLLMFAIGALMESKWGSGIKSKMDAGKEAIESIVETACGIITSVMKAIGQAIFGDKTPIQMLTDDLAYFADTLGGGDFVDNFNKLANINFSPEMIGNLIGLIVVEAVTAVVGFLEGLATSVTYTGDESGENKTCVQRVVDDLAYFATILGGQDFINNFNALAELQFSADLIANLAGLLLLAAILTGLGFLAGLAEGVNLVNGEIEDKKTNVQRVVDDIAYFATILGGEKFINDFNALAEIQFSPELIANLAGLLLLEAILVALGFLKRLAEGFNLVTGEVEDKKSDVQRVVDDIAYFATILGGEKFINDFNSIAKLQFDEQMITNLAGLLLLDALTTAAGFLTGVASGLTYGGDESGENRSVVKRVVDDLAYLAETLGGDKFKTDLESIGNIEIDPQTLANLATFESLEFFTSIVGLIGGLTSLGTRVATGRTSVDQFIHDIQKIAQGLSDETLAENLGKIATMDIPVEQMEQLKKAVKDTTIQGFIDALIEFFTLGEETPVEQFGKDVEGLGNALAKWSIAMLKVKMLGGFSVPADEIAQLKESIDAVAKDGGLLGAIQSFVTGDAMQNLADFKEQAGSLGEAIVTFVGGLSGTNLKKLSIGAQAAGDLATIMSEVNAISMTDQYASPFSGALDTISHAIDTFAKNISDEGLVVDVVSASTDFITALNTLIDFKLEGDLTDETKVSDFADLFGRVFSMIVGLNDKDFSGADRFRQAVDTVASADLGGALDSSSSSGSASAGKESGSKAGENAVSSATDSIEKGSSKVADAVGNVFTNAVSGVGKTGYNAGFDMVAQMAAGISANDAVSTAVSDMVSGAVSSLSQFTDAYDAGKAIGLGFEQGILSQIMKVKIAAAAVAKAAIEKAKEELNAHSPSRVMIEVGGFFGEGFAIGILSQAKNVSDSAETLGRGAIKGMRGAIEFVNNALSTEIDMEPTIRPVLDLSEIQNGASSISGMLNDVTPLSVYGNMSAINQSMALRNGSASLDDVVSALGNVEKSAINNSRGDTYIVDGITYDDGSNITDAVRSLIRAARVGRRA